jgi:5'-methylthioadenosine phosphorylase
MPENRIGVVGGSGLYEMEQLEDREEVRLSTPFGEPSDAYILGTLQGVPVAFLSRHGRGHRYSPHEVPYRANIYGFKKLGVERLLSMGAVGSLRIDIEPLHVVVPDQFFDRTRGRKSTFFEDGVVAHVSFSDPVCAELANVLVDSADAAGCHYHRGGTYVCMEGPQFSTRAESELYRSWGLDIIGMTNLTEAKLAREAQICYATMAMVTDYDCWHEEEEEVTAEMILANLHHNVADAQRILLEAVTRVPSKRTCGCGTALQYALLADPTQISEEHLKRFALLLGVPEEDL